MSQLLRFRNTLAKAIIDFNRIETGLDASVRYVHDTEVKQVLDVKIVEVTDMVPYRVTIEKLA